MQSSGGAAGGVASQLQRRFSGAVFWVKDFKGLMISHEGHGATQMERALWKICQRFLFRLWPGFAV